MTLHPSAVRHPAIPHRTEARGNVDHARSADDRALGTGAPRGVRALLWILLGSAVAAVFTLALAFVQ